MSNTISFQRYGYEPARFFVTETHRCDGRVETLGYPVESVARQYAKSDGAAVAEPGFWRIKEIRK